MPGKVQHEYPADEELLVLAEATNGNLAEASRRLGFHRMTLRHYIESRPKVREAFTKARLGKPLGQNLPVDDPNLLALQQHKAEVKHLRARLSEYEKAFASQEQLFDRITETVQRPASVPRFKPPKQSKSLPARSVVCPIFDQQYGQLVVPEDVPSGKGAFSAEVFDQRLDRYVDAWTRSLKDYSVSHRIDEVIFPMGGDHVEGYEIFAGQAWQLEKDPVQQVWDLACKMEGALKHMVSFAREELGVKRVRLYGIAGNHGKVGGKKAGATPASYNWDLLYLKLLADPDRGMLRGWFDEVGIEPGGALYFESAGHIFLMVHGDQIRGWGGLPFYGLAKFDGRQIRQGQVLYDYLLMGHHHQPASIPNGSGEHIVSGDWVGANNLTRIIGQQSRPQQGVLFVAEKYGITERATVHFQLADEAKASAYIYGRG